MSKWPKMVNDYAEVTIDAALQVAIAAVQAAADELQMTPAEFIREFDYGMPQCPECGKQH